MVYLRQEDLDTLERKQKDINNKSCLLKEVPCGSEFSHCKFIKDAYDALDKKDDLHQQVQDFLFKKEKTEVVIEELNPEQIQSYLDKYEKLKTKQGEIKTQIVKVELSLEKRKHEI